MTTVPQRFMVSPTVSTTALELGTEFTVKTFGSVHQGKVAGRGNVRSHEGDSNSHMVQE